MADDPECNVSVTSSDLGSSCENGDVKVPTQDDVKEQPVSDDAASVGGSVTLTLDSLEEEEEEEVTEQAAENTSLSETMNCSKNSDEGPDNSIASCKDKYKVSELAVHSDHRRDSGSDSGAAQVGDVCDGPTENGIDPIDQGHVTPEKQHSSPDHAKTNSVSSDLEAEAENETEDRLNQADSCRSASTDTTENVSQNPPSCSAAVTDGRLILSKSSSLNEETSTDVAASPRQHRRSGIPRRASQSGVTSSTPQQSPVPARRNLALSSLPARRRSHSSAPNSTLTSPCRTSPASFPQTPVRGRSRSLRRSRSASQSDAIAVSSAFFRCSPSPVARDNVSSRLRYEKHHQNAQQEDAYLTPYERKDFILKELKAEVKQLNKQLEDTKLELEQLRESVNDEKEQVRQRFQAELDEAKALTESAEKEVRSLRESYTESITTAASLRQQLDAVKKDMRDKLAESEEIFLEMYNKGRESAIFEHEEEMELKRKGGRSAEATERELHNKLVRTQAELAKWQTIQRHESYHTMPVPGTEAETTLRFLKDAVFHFLTTDKKDSDEHLRAIVRILRFSDTQREKIAHAIILKRNKHGW